MLQDMGTENYRCLFSQNGEAEKFAGPQNLTHQPDAGKRKGEAKSHTYAVKQGRNRRIFGGIAFRTAQDDTVYHDQRDVNAQGAVQKRYISF